MSKSQPKTEVVAKPKQIKLKQKRRVESGGGAKLRLRLPRSHQSWTHPSIMPWWKGSKEKKDEKIQKEKLAWAEAQELVRIMRAKNEREKKKPPKSSAALKEAECMTTQGLMGAVRGYRVCLFRPERTTVLRWAVGGRFSQAKPIGYRLISPERHMKTRL